MLSGVSKVCKQEKSRAETRGLRKINDSKNPALRRKAGLLQLRS
jgi:hypothetical protein